MHEPTPVLEYGQPTPPRQYSSYFIRALMTIIATALIFGLGGALVGMLLGYCVPSYYRGMFLLSTGSQRRSSG